MQIKLRKNKEQLNIETMKTLYAISMGGCRDGIYLDYVTNDLSKVDTLAKKFFETENSYNNDTYSHCEYDLKEAEIHIYYIDYNKKVCKRTFNFIDIGELI